MKLKSGGRGPSGGDAGAGGGGGGGRSGGGGGGIVVGGGGGGVSGGGGKGGGDGGCGGKLGSGHVPSGAKGSSSPHGLPSSQTNSKFTRQQGCPGPPHSSQRKRMHALPSEHTKSTTSKLVKTQHSSPVPPQASQTLSADPSANRQLLVSSQPSS